MTPPTPLPEERRAPPALLSLVIPLYNEQEVLPLLRQRLEAVAQTLGVPVEWVLVNDGSRDATAALLFQWAAQDRRAKVVQLARNFGHQAAVTAGLDHARGDAVVAMDADLQDPPELVATMIERYLEGYDVVFAQRTLRLGEGPFKRWTAKLFYWLMATFVHADLPPEASDFRLMSRRVLVAIAHLREGQRFLRGMVTWLGFYQVAVPFERPPRAAGETKYPLSKMFSLAWDAVVSFSSAPLRIATYAGSLLVAFGLAGAAYAFFRQLVFHDLVPGWAPLVILHGLIGGATLFGLGLIGEYVGRIYEEIKQRPIYIVARTANVERQPAADRAVVECPPPPPPGRIAGGAP